MDLPVYFASAGDREFYWTSATDARHSRHLAERPQVSMVIFDSTVAPYHGRAVYAVGEARELSGSDLDRALSAYPRPDGRGATPVTREEVTGRPRTASTRRRCRTCGSCVPGDPDSRACSTASPWTTEPA